MMMSAIKTHDVWDVIHGDGVLVQTEEGERTHTVRSILVNRQQPFMCQIFTEGENTGSLSSRETNVLNAKINTITPNSQSTDFSINAKVGETRQILQLKTVKNTSSDCTIC